MAMLTTRNYMSLWKTKEISKSFALFQQKTPRCLHRDIRFVPMSTTTSSQQTHYILSFYVPSESTSQVCARVCQKSGAGSYPGGLYTEAYWITRGTGQFRAMEGANPAIGSAGGQVEKVEEDKVEILCLGRECAKKAVEELKKAHPYEEVPYYIVKSEDL